MLIVTVLMNAVLALVLLCLTLKLIAILNAGRWTVQYGAGYGTRFRAEKPGDDQARLDLLKDSGRWFFPFGIKDYRLRQYYQPHAADSPRRARMRRAVAATARNLFSARRLVIASLVILVLCNMSRSVNPVAPALLVFVAFTQLSVSTALVAEAIMWYVVVRSYARPFFMLGFSRTWVLSASEAAEEIRVFARLTAYVLISSVVACSTVQVWFGGFEGVGVASGVAAELNRLAEFAYYALCTMTTTGDSGVKPTTGMASLVGVFLLVQTLFIVLFALSLISSVLLPPQPPEKGHS